MRRSIRAAVRGAISAIVVVVMVAVGGAAAASTTDEVLIAANGYRSTGLIFDQTLANEAQAWADKMSGATHSGYARQGWSIAEVVAWAPSGNVNSWDIALAWSNSPSHNAIMRSTAYTHAGAGYSIRGGWVMILGYSTPAPGWAAPAPAPGVVAGAIVAKDATGAGVNGVVAFTRAGSCSAAGTGVWRGTTATSRWSNGGYGVSLAPGAYCTTTEGVPSGGYGLPDPVETVVTSPGPVWITLWIPKLVSGAIVAKDSAGVGINGVTSLTRAGPCAAPGAGVWRSTTATNRWSTGGYGVSLRTGVYCSTVEGVPAGYVVPAPVETAVTSPGPIWVTLWVGKS